MGQLVVMPDGQTVELPDNPSPSEMALLDRIARAGTDTMGGIKEGAKQAFSAVEDVGRGFWKGLGGMGQLGLNTLSARLSNPFSERMQEGGLSSLHNTPQWASQAISENLDQPEGRTGVRKYVEAGLEGVGGAMAGGPTRASAVIAGGGGAGLGGEAGSQMSGGDPRAQILASILGGVLGGGATAAKTNRQALVNEATSGVTAAQLEAAKKLMIEAAEKSGINLNLSQAMSSPSNIDDIVNDLANSRYGKSTTGQLRVQPKEVELAADLGMANLPGKSQMPQQIANRAQDAATAEIKRLQQAAGTAWQKQAPQGEAFSPQALASLDASLAAAAAKYPNTAGADLMNEVRAALKQPGSQPDPKQMLGSGLVSSKIPVAQANKPPAYLSDALQVKGAIEDVLSTYGARKLNTPNLDATTQRRAQEIRELFNLMIDTEAPKLKAANDAYSLVMKNSVEPAKKSVVGRVAGIGGSSADREAVQSRIFSVLDAGTDPNAAKSEILTLEKAMRGSDPTAFADTVKTWLSRKLGKAVKQEGGRTGDNTAGNIERALLGEGNQRQGFNDMMVGLARSQGLPDDALLPGMRTLLQHISAAARRPGSVTQFPARDLEATAGKSLTGTALQSNAVTPGWAIGKQLKMLLSADAYRFMDKLLTSPEGVDTLIKLSKQPVMSKAAANTLSTFAATFEQSQGIIPE